jgi:hypothetical protein
MRKNDVPGVSVTEIDGVPGVPGVPGAVDLVVPTHPAAAMLRRIRDTNAACGRRAIEFHIEKPPDPAHRNISR